VVQELYRGTAARRAMTRDAWPVALAALVQRNRRRYGGYLVHVGVAVLLIGVAASSSFQHSLNVWLKPGGKAKLDGYVFHYVRPTERATSERISLGSIVDVTQNGRHVVTLDTFRSIYPSTSESDGIIGSFFDSANADSTVGLDAGPFQDIWSVVNSSNLEPVAGLITKGNRLFQNEYNAIVSATAKDSVAKFHAALTASHFYQYRDAAVIDIASQYKRHPWPVQFLLIIDPMVSWLWFGAIIMAFGGFIALWPMPFAARRRELAVYRARLARELA
jgi:cytochrome c-type biogenesis protein CcmF